MSIKSLKPGLFGINNSNRDFSQQKFWGKNNFNSSFPASLACYMNSLSINPVYLIINDDLEIEHSYISVTDLFGIEPNSPNLYFAFERDYAPYQILVFGNLPSVDLVTIDNSKSACLKPIEIKLTALPDETTYQESDDKYGCELVIRTPTIIYLALAIAELYLNDTPALLEYLEPTCNLIKDWNNLDEILPNLLELINCLDLLLINKINHQKPLIMQQIWKTVGKSFILREHCLDIFVWSDFAITRLFINNIIAATKLNMKGDQMKGREVISRPIRTVIWLCKMLYDFANNGSIDHRNIIGKLTYGTKNDKAFSVSGTLTNPLMKCSELTEPRITKNEIKNIILNSGEKFLSPERRFDATIVNSPELF